ncbi:stressosome-associated protein Prli42 [Marinicrinis sediminis]|uniref:Stressosome-associated protein Prli42 n=1 Tax=Marinicrinis sediminis TaxID=1652465 RepID=A0ABW5RCY5_9BACL
MKRGKIQKTVIYILIFALVLSSVAMGLQLLTGQS